MGFTSAQVMQYVEENDVKFVRLAFCDIFGHQKNIAIMPSELRHAFEYGIGFDASAVAGFMNVEESDLFLFPDPDTLCLLPWRSQQGRVVRLFCHICRPGGAPFAGDGRRILKEVQDRASAMGLGCRVGAECEFYLFERDEAGHSTRTPHDLAGYLDVSPLDRGENVRRDICLTLEEMGILPESSHHEQGPGQNEVDFKYDEPLRAADALVTFKTVVRTTAMQNGLFASFMPKPLQGHSGSGLHINLSLLRGGLNIFKLSKYEHSRDAESFIAGVLRRTAELSVFLNPLTNSYARLGTFSAPAYVSWSHQNRSQLVRIPAADAEGARMELRSPDPACNPYFAYALLIAAGLEGVQDALPLPPSADLNLFSAPADKIAHLTRLPRDLGEAVRLALDSTFIKTVLPDDTAERYLLYKTREWESYEKAGKTDTFETNAYFHVY